MAQIKLMILKFQLQLNYQADMISYKKFFSIDYVFD